MEYNSWTTFLDYSNKISGFFKVFEVESEPYIPAPEDVNMEEDKILPMPK